MNRNALAVAAVILPIVVLVGGIADAERHKSVSTNVLLHVSGYDPRDLLRGRYLRFRIDPPSTTDAATCGGEGCCWCLIPGENQAASAILRTCSEALACPAHVPANELKGPKRYYIPEQNARETEKRFLKAVREKRALVEVAIDRKGKMEIVDMRF